MEGQFGDCRRLDSIHNQISNSVCADIVSELDQHVVEESKEIEEGRSCRRPHRPVLYNTGNSHFVVGDMNRGDVTKYLYSQPADVS